MQPFQEADLPAESFDPQWVANRMKCDLPTAEQLVKFNREQVVYMNDEFQVNVHKANVTSPAFPAMLHLSIKRRDRQPIHDWRVLQEIKNLIVGPTHEAVELYPSEERLTDTANQYHLWVLAEPGLMFPFGFFDGRNVSDTAEAAEVGATQRPLPQSDAPAAPAVILCDQCGGVHSRAATCYCQQE